MVMQLENQNLEEILAPVWWGLVDDKEISFSLASLVSLRVEIGIATTVSLGATHIPTSLY